MDVGSVQGLWRRSLLVLPNGMRDETSWVAWLQVGPYFVDLRQAADGTQDGFAGELLFDGTWFEWRRDISYRPQAAPDAGRLRFEGDVLVEEGRYAPYVEHWRRDDASGDTSVWRMEDRGLLLRRGSVFGVAVAAAAGVEVSFGRDGVVERSLVPERVGGAATGDGWERLI